jgi:hypothetical protein
VLVGLSTLFHSSFCMSRIHGLQVMTDKSCWPKSLKLLLLWFFASSVYMWESSSFFRWHRRGLPVGDLNRWALGSLLGLTGVCHLRRPTPFRAKGVCLLWEINASTKLWSIFWSVFWASSFVNSNTWHLICNNYFIAWISWYCMITCCVCVFLLHWESLDMILGDKPFLFQGGSIRVGIRARVGVKHTWKHLKIATTLSMKNA